MNLSKMPSTKLFVFPTVISGQILKSMLCWIAAHNKELKTFIENKVQKVHRDTNVSNCFHCDTCDTKSNPADLLTRNKPPDSFQQNTL